MFHNLNIARHALGLILITFTVAVHARQTPDVRYIPARPEFAPNPGAIRDETIDLSGVWRFMEGDDPAAEHLPPASRHRPFAQEILVPFVPQAPASRTGKRNVNEAIWYDREIALPADWEGGLLHFEGIDYEAQIYVNDQLAAVHRGAYDPIQVNMTPFLNRGRTAGGKRIHRITVRVTDSNADKELIAGKQEREFSEGGIFYRNMTGIWKGVYVERIRSAYISTLHLLGNDKGQLALKAEVALNPGKITTARQFPAKARVTLRFEDEETPVLEREVDVRDGQIELLSQIEDAKLWSTEAPNLYFAEVELLDTQGTPIDRVQSYTGFVTFSQKDGYLTENGYAYQVRGHLNQHVYPDTLYTTTDQKILHEIGYFKAAGFNTERYHQSTPRFRDLFLFSRHGVRISLELPAARDLRSESAQKEALEQWYRILRAYSAVPSVGWRVAVNETWGLLNDPSHFEDDSDQRLIAAEKFQRDMHAVTQKAHADILPASASGFAKAMQPFNDGWESISHMREGKPDGTTDPSSYFFAVHDYTDAERLLMYMPLGENGRPITSLPDNQRPALLNGYEFPPNVPVMISEMGGRAVTHSHNPKIFAYNAIFTETGAWAEAMAGTITVAGLAPVFTAGYVITQTMDAGNDPDDPDSTGELNGLLRADGTPKVPARYWRKVNDDAHKNWRQNLVKRSPHLANQPCEEFLQKKPSRRLREKAKAS